MSQLITIVSVTSAGIVVLVGTVIATGLRVVGCNTGSCLVMVFVVLATKVIVNAVMRKRPVARPRRRPITMPAVPVRPVIQSQ